METNDQTSQPSGVGSKDLLGELEQALIHAQEAAKQNDWNNRPDTALNVAHSITFLRAAIGVEKAYRRHSPNEELSGRGPVSNDCNKSDTRASLK